MHTHASLLAIAPLVLLARADMDFDLNDAPRACQDICRPIADLSRSCEVDLPGDDNDREEDQLEAQCFCSNDSFEVNSVAAQCQDCVRQERESARNNNNNNNNDGNDTDDDDDDDDDDDYDDAWEDINAIVRTCGFSSTTYMASATETAAAITVTATRPTDAAQLTTTFTAARETGQSNNNNDNNDNNDDNDDNNDNNDDGGDNAAGALAPYWMAGAIVAGAVAMMA